MRARVCVSSHPPPGGRRQPGVRVEGVGRVWSNWNQGQDDLYQSSISGSSDCAHNLRVRVGEHGVMGG